MKRVTFTIAGLLGASAGWSGFILAQEPGVSRGIADNSFLIEEAYNQEPGVVQHISALLRSRSGGAWLYTFTQEWPVWSQKSQLSFTLPVQRVEDGAASVTGVGDVALNYRYQLAGVRGPVAVAPRLSLLLPTGAERNGLGRGALGLQANVPVSVTVARQLLTHWNVGATVIPSAGTSGYNLGASAIWLLRPAFNVLLEIAWVRSPAAASGGATTTRDELFINPGIRWTHDFSSGLQIVPGIAFPIGAGPSAGDHGIFLYLSFEHPFLKKLR